MFIIPDTYYVKDFAVVFDVHHFSDPLDIKDGTVSVFTRNYDWRDSDVAIPEHHFMNQDSTAKLWQSTFSVDFKDGRCNPQNLAIAVHNLIQKCGYHGRYVEAVKVIDHPEPVEGLDNMAIQVFIGS